MDDENMVVATVYPSNIDLVRRAVQAARENGATGPDAEILGELLAIGAQQIVSILRRAGAVPGVLQ